MFIFQVHHYIKPESVESYLAATLENARQTVLEPGVLRFDVFQDKEDPTHFSLLEIYRDDEARAKHLETAHFLKWKDVYMQSYARRGNGNEFTVHFPAEADWSRG
jgi:quinol monooxygenase YgiN